MPERPEGGPALPEHGRAQTLRAWALYLVLVTGGAILLALILRSGRHLAGPHTTASAAGAGGGSADADVVWRLLVASAVIIAAARAMGSVFQRINQPQVVGEITAGVVLGPSVLGKIAPGLSSALFASRMLPYLDVFSQVGLLFFMFLIGLELDYRLIRGRGHTAATVSHMSIIVPFLLGAGAALVMFPVLGSPTRRFVPFALFLGASMSITAFPVLARILTERGIYKTPLGAITLTCAAVDDVTAWCILAIVVAVARANGVRGVTRTVVLAVVFVLVMTMVVRPLLGRLARWHEDRGEIGGGVLALLFVGILLSAVATDRIGIHAIFGAFLFGAVMPQRSELIAELVAKLEDFTVVFLLPLYFAFTGLRTNIGLLGSNPTRWMLCGLVIAVAIGGKWGGSTLAARVNGLSMREALAVGVLMNTRGLTELIILNIGLDLRVIPPELFAMLVIMALVTTFMTTPLLSLLYPADVLDRMIAESTDEEVEGAMTILIPIDKSERSTELVDLALRLIRPEERGRLLLLRTVRLPGSAYRAGPRIQESLLAGAQRNMRPLVQRIEAAGHNAVPIVLPTRRPADAIVRVAAERRPDLVLLRWRRSLWGDRLLAGVVGEVLRKAPADVAVVVDATGRGVPLGTGDQIVVPYGGGFHEDNGLDLALRLARSTGADVRLAGPAADAGRLTTRASEAYETTGVWTEAVPVAGDEPAAGLADQGEQSSLMVLGVGDSWAKDQRSLGGLRHAVAARTTTPLIIVRRQGRTSWRRRRPEWVTGERAEAELSETKQEIGRKLG